MRILHVVASDRFAGVERHIARLADAETAAGDRVHVVGGDPARMRADLPAGCGFTPATTVGDVVRALDANLLRADVLNVHMTGSEVGVSVAGLLPGRRLPPVVATRHFPATRGTGRLAPVIAAVAARPVRAQIAVSRYVAERIDGPAVVVLSGTPSAPDALPAAARERVVLLVQRLETEKATDVALTAFAASGLAGEGWRCEIAGDGARRTGLGALAGRLGLGAAVRFLGARDDVPALMARSAVLLAPSPDEALGLSVLEALAAGLPVVADDSGGHRETLGGLHPAALYATRDVAAATAALGDLARDADARDAYAAAGQARQRRDFTLTRQQVDTRAVYLGFG